jgi:hypothetical protein
MPFPGGFIYLIMVLLICGVLLWAVSAMPALDATVKQFIRIIIIVILAIYVIYFVFGMFSGGHAYIPR